MLWMVHRGVILVTDPQGTLRAEPHRSVGQTRLGLPWLLLCQGGTMASASRCTRTDWGLDTPEPQAVVPL